MSRNVLKLATTALMLLPLLAKAECKDLVMRMASPDGKREITTFFNCHGGSYQIPEATTTHFYEWKSNKLCETTRVCGNVSAWRGTFGVGAMWTFGSSVTDFAQKVNYLNQSNGTGQPNYVNYIQANNGNVCLNLASNQVLTYQQSGATTNALNCYPKAMMGQANWASALNALSGVGYQPVGGGNINDQSINFVCAQGDQNTLLSSANGVVKQANVQDCNSANITVNNNGDRGYAPVSNTSSGYQSARGSRDTDYNQLQLHVNFQLAWENIERYCKAPDPEFCY